MGKYIGSTATIQPTQASAGGVYTLKDQLVYNTREQWPVGRDPYFNQTTLLLQGDVPYTRGRNAMTLPLAYNSDASTNNLLITPNGDVGPRPFSPYFGNNYSVYFDGSNSRVQFPTGNIIPASSNYTIDFWINPIAVAPTYGSGIFSQGTTPSGDNGRTSMGINSSGQLSFGIGETFPSFNSGNTTLKFGQWSYVALTRNSNVFTMYINGVRVNQVTSTKATDSGFFRLGTIWDGDGNGLMPLTGYIHSFRITYAVLTDFSIPTVPSVATTSTALLTCQTNRFQDLSTNQYTTTISGSPRVTDNSPFVSTDSTSGSAYFDGTGDSLSNIGTTTSFNVLHQGTPKFTIEAYVYVTTTISNYMVIFDNCGFGSTGHGITFDINNSGYLNLFIVIGTSGSWVINSASTTVVPTNQWVHVAATYDHSLASNNLTFYINGTSAGSFSKTANSPSSNNASYAGRIGSDQAGNYAFQGYISNLRITNTVASAPLLPTQSLTSNSNTLLLTLQTRATSQNINFIDSSLNELLVTKSGNTTQGTFSPFSPSGWSNYFNGASTQYFTAGSAANWTFLHSGADFTIEFWFYYTDTGNGPIINTNYGSSSNVGFYLAIIGATGTLEYGFARGVANNEWYPSSTSNLTKHSWNHIAITMVNATKTLSFYINGQAAGSSSNTGFGFSSASPTNTLRAGSGTILANSITGYVSNLRISNIVRTGLTTVPTAPYSADANTVLLTCQSNRFRDNSPNNFTITPANSLSVQAFSPFAPQNAVSPLVTGGSGYFDGSSDYLQLTDSANQLDLGGIQASLDFWIYMTNTAVQNILSKGGGNSGSAWSTTDGAEYVIAYNSGVLYLTVNNAGGTLDLTGNFTTNQWNHVAIATNTSNAISMYINGSRVDTDTNAITKPTNRTLFRVGTFLLANWTYGYLTNIRHLRGDAAFNPSDTNIVIPTTPPTAIPNTSLLLNFTNGAAVDATGRNVLESVGNVHTTRAQAKFDQLIGGSSLYFDGVGDYINVPINTLYNFGTSDFTIECWLFQLSRTANEFDVLWCLNGPAVTGTAPYRSGMYLSLGAYPNNASFLISNSAENGWAVQIPVYTNLPTLNTWEHWAVVRSGSTFTVYRNGINIGTATSSASVINNRAPFSIGAQGTDGSNYFDGYIQNFRITRYARYLTGTGANANQMVFNGTNVLALPTAPFPRG